MSICNTCHHDGGDPGNLMLYVHCLKLDCIIKRVDECEDWEEADDDAD